jgi:hypothetical protein
MSEPEISLDELLVHASGGHHFAAEDNVQPGVRIEQRRRSCLSHFMSLLKAVYSSGRIITNLVAIDLPKAIFVGTEYEVDIMKGVFFPLRNLDLKFSEFPHSDWLSRGGDSSYFRGRNLVTTTLRKLLNEPRDLQRLALSFPEGREREFSFDIFDQTNLDRFPRTWLPGLKQLNLSNFLCAWSDLKNLLEDTRGLKALTLREGTLETGSMISLLTTLRELKLDDFCIDGKWRVQEDVGEWHSHDEETFYDCEQYEGRFAHSGMRPSIESYVISGGPCPLPALTPDGHQDRIWENQGDMSWHYISHAPL